MDSGAVAELEQVGYAPVAGLQRQLAVAGAARHFEHLGCGPQAGCRVLGVREGDVSGAERGGERGGGPGPSRRLDGLEAHRLAEARVSVIGQLDR